MVPSSMETDQSPRAVLRSVRPVWAGVKGYVIPVFSMMQSY